jgi:hypothetical protein
LQGTSKIGMGVMIESSSMTPEEMQAQAQAAGMAPM